MNAEYVSFYPPRRPEEFVGIAGPHGGLALPHDVLHAIAQSRVTNRPHPYLVRGEWIRGSVHWLDVAVDVQWVINNTDYELVNGYLRAPKPSQRKTA